MFSMRVAIATLFALSLSICFATAPRVVMASDGNALVNVEVGNINTGPIASYNNVDIGTAAQIAANVCGNQVDVLTVVSALSSGNYSCSNDQTMDYFNGQLVGTPTLW